MAYVTGNANSMADLLTALQNACTANGWTLSGNVLHQGACYVQITANAQNLSIMGGTGLDANLALVDPAPNPVYFATCTPDPWTWPITYHAFVFPAEVYLVAQNNVDSYPWLGFGTNPLAGLGGTGNWVSSVLGDRGYASYGGVGYDCSWERSYASSNYSLTPCLFSYDWYAAGDKWSNFLHADLGAGASWYACYSQNFTNYLCARQPNVWNGDSLLAPIQPGIFSAASTCQMIAAALDHARYTRIDNLAPAQIIDIGADRWMVFPWWRKDKSFGGFNDGTARTAGYGHAIRYDGP